MSILASLVRAYDRMENAPPMGFSSEKIGFCIEIDQDGQPMSMFDLRDTDKKRTPRQLLVPQPVKRTAGIAPNFLWDKSSYVLGVTAGEGKRTTDEHAAFKDQHLNWLGDTSDEGLLALTRFLETWQPDAFVPPFADEDALDLNIVFRLSSERNFLHDRPAARRLWSRITADRAATPQICLVSGEDAPSARLHPSIKGVWGAQSSGASLVSFNRDAFKSYGHDKGDNAPVSEAAAFAYTAALNRFLERDSGHRIQIGDASTVFWADAKDMEQADLAESLFAAFIDTDQSRAENETMAENRIATHLKLIRQGRPLDEVEPDLAAGVRFNVLGLAPNASRLSARFWWQNDFGRLTAHYQRFVEDMRIDPPPRDGWPPLWRYLLELATQSKRENVPPLVAGDWMRAILTGTPYPLTLLSSVLMRIRADGQINALRVALLKSVLIRNFAREVPVALDPASNDNAYVLGRLFAAYENVQKAALGKSVNATIRDKFYGSASANPARVFGHLASNSFNHLAKVRKERAAFAQFLQNEIEDIASLLEVGDDPFPRSLNQEAQARFALGYYHQANFRKQTTSEVVEPTEDTQE